MPTDATNTTAGPAATSWRARLRALFGNPRLLIATVLLLLQAIFITALRFSSEPCTHVAPVGGQTSYRLFVMIDGRSLDREEIRVRYALPHRDRTSLTPAGLRQVVERRESSDFRRGATSVRLHTRYNDEPEEIWLWPRM